MALGQIPPWLDVKPSDFLRATESGYQSGLQVARMRQAAEEAAANRADRATQMNNEMQLRQWEREEQNRMRADQNQAEREKSRQELQAQMAYQMANLGLRQNAESAREDESSQNLDFRKTSEARMQQQADLSGQRLTLSQQEAQRRQQQADQQLDPATKEQVALAREKYKSVLSQLRQTTDPASAKALKSSLDSIKQEIMGYLQPGGGGDAGAAPTGAPPLFGPGGAMGQPDLSGGLQTVPMPTIPMRPDAPQGPAPGGSLAAPPPMAAPSAPTWNPAPLNPKDREAGQTYQTPKGPHTWDGSHWKPYAPPAHDDSAAGDLPMPAASVPAAAAVDDDVPEPE